MCSFHFQNLSRKRLAFSLSQNFLKDETRTGIRAVPEEFRFRPNSPTPARHPRNFLRSPGPGSFWKLRMIVPRASSRCVPARVSSSHPLPPTHPPAYRKCAKVRARLGREQRRDALCCELSGSARCACTQPPPPPPRPASGSLVAHRRRAGCIRR